MKTLIIVTTALFAISIYLLFDIERKAENWRKSEEGVRAYSEAISKFDDPFEITPPGYRAVKGIAWGILLISGIMDIVFIILAAA